MARDDPQLSKLLRGSSGSGGSGGGGNSDGRGRANPQHVRQLTDRFYTLIPHISKRSVLLPTIDTPRLLREKMDMLDALINAQVASRVIADASTSMHPLDARHEQMRTKLSAVERIAQHSIA
jgi:hypothetical protein